MGLSEFYVVGYRQRWELEQLTSGNYSRLCADILFSRSMGYYIIQVRKFVIIVKCICCDLVNSHSPPILKAHFTFVPSL